MRVWRLGGLKNLQPAHLKVLQHASDTLFFDLKVVFERVFQGTTLALGRVGLVLSVELEWGVEDLCRKE